MFRSNKTATLAGLTLALLALGCGGFQENPDNTIIQDDKVSDCGGFGVLGQPLLDGAPAYCAAEMLYWQYEADTQTLRLANTRVLLNCCGDHSMTIEQQNGQYVVTELDEPQYIEGVEGGARCSCMCVFDFTVEAQGIPQDVISLKLVRVVPDWESASGDIYEGDINLSEGSGSIVIDETDSHWCEEPAD